MKTSLNGRPAPSGWRLLLADRLSQLVIGLVFLLISGGFVVNRGTDGGHEDFAAYRLAPMKTELRRDLANAQRLGLMDDAMRPKVAAVLADMEGHGYQPFIDGAVYRTPAEQAAKVRQGVSKVYYSFHNVTSQDGKPDSLAADIADTRWGWSNKCPRRYWLMLASSCENHGLNSGIYFGLNSKKRAKDRANLKAAIKARNWTYTGPFGWDAAHCEPPTSFTLSQAKRGLRPFAVRYVVHVAPKTAAPKTKPVAKAATKPATKPTVSKPAGCP
jgi:hypothetical protein